MYLTAEIVLLAQTLPINMQTYIMKEAYSLAISGDTIAIGDVGDGSNASGVNGDQNNNRAPGSGAVFVLVRNGTNWGQQAYLKATPPHADEGFGEAVAISGDTIVVGASDDASGTGAAWVFVRNGTNWTQQAFLKASNAEVGDSFADRDAVAISGDTIVIGARTESSNARGVNGDQNNNNALWAGAAYVFVRNGTNWTQQAYLKASNNRPGIEQFGESVAISGNRVVVSSGGDDSSAVGVNGDQEDNSAEDSGAVHVFVRNGTNWSHEAYLKASNTERDDGFGSVVALSGDTLVAGAPYEDSSATGVNGDQNDNSAGRSGAAYVFVRTGTNWSQQAYLKASNASAESYFGHPGQVAISDDTIVVRGSGLGDGLFVFARQGTNWHEAAFLPHPKPPDDSYGSPAVSGDTLVVSGTMAGEGMACVFTGLETSTVELAIAQSVGGLRISWPVYATDFVLDETSALESPPAATIWSEISPPYENDGTVYFIIVPAPAGNTFYRLRKP